MATKESGQKMGITPAALLRRITALSPSRLWLLTAGFLAALGALLFVEWRDGVAARRIETELRIDRAASDCAGKAGIVLLSSGDMRAAFAECHPGGRAAIYYLDAERAIRSVYGASKAVHIDGVDAKTLAAETSGGGRMTAASGRLYAAWRPLDDGGLVVVAGPADDLFGRTPEWIGYGLIFLAITLVVGALAAAVSRQSAIAADAARAVNALQDLRAALEAGRASAWRHDGATRTVSFSRTLLEPLGLGARDRVFALSEISALVHPDDLRTAIAILLGGPDGVSEGAVRLRNPAGGWSQIYLRAGANQGDMRAKRETVRRGVAFDFSGEPALRPGRLLAEARLKDAIESLPDAFVLWDARGRLAVWNRRFARLFRFAGDALTPGLPWADVAARAGAGAETIERFFAPETTNTDQLAEAQLAGDRWIRVSRRSTAEGGLVCVATSVTDLKRRARAQKKKERELQGLVAALEASRAELSETMRKYQIEKHRAEDASRSKSEFLAKMSHELRTPLNAINGFSEIMRAELYGPIGDAKYREYVEDILASGTHLLALIDDMLDMSKIESGRVDLEPKRVDLDKLLRECARLVAKRAAEGEVTLSVAAAPAPIIYADARGAKQVVLNLLTNAVKFTPKGGAVTLSAEADLDSVTVFVADDGAGIEKTALAQLGAPFERGPAEASGHQGSGIGLALSKSLMELMGGALALVSEPGKGTVAAATFPRRKDATVRIPTIVKRRGRVLTEPSSKPTASAAPKAAE